MFDRPTNIFRTGSVGFLLIFLCAGCSTQNLNSRANSVPADLALFLQGWKFSIGIGVEQDLKKAKGFFEKSDRLGLLIAKHELAHTFDNMGGEINKKIAEKYYREAISLGDISSYEHLIDLLSGKSTKQIVPEAIKNIRRKEIEEFSLLEDKFLSGEVLEDSDLYILAQYKWWNAEKKSQSIKEAIKILELLADKGNADAMHDLSHIFSSEEHGVEKDFEKQFYWLSQAVNSIPEEGRSNYLKDLYKISPWNDVKHAAIELGNIYWSGTDIETDYALAVSHYRTAAYLGNPQAFTNIGNAFYVGKGVPQDYKKALDYYKKGYKRGNRQATNMLGWMNYNGQGNLAKDYLLALKYFKEGADANIPSAMFGLGRIFDTSIDTSPIQSDMDLAINWYQKAGDKGYIDAITVLSHYYREGVGVDVDKSFTWTKKGAELGDAELMHWLGWMYWKGQGVSQNYRKAVDWYIKAKDLEYKKSYNNLAYMYQFGYGVKKDTIYAELLYKKAIELGHRDAIQNLANLYYQKESYSERARILRIGADQGDSESQYKLGLAFMEGKGVTKSSKLGLEWIEKAASQDYGNALYELGFTFFSPKWGLDRDLHKARGYFKGAAETGHIQGLGMYGKMLYLGEGGDVDRVEGREAIRKSAEKGGSIGKYYLAKIYEKGDIQIPQNDHLAFDLFLEAAHDNQIDAQYTLYEKYRAGAGVEKNEEEGIRWLLKSARKGLEKAKVEVIRLGLETSLIESNTELSRTNKPELFQRKKGPTDITIGASKSSLARRIAIVIGISDYKFLKPVGSPNNGADIYDLAYAEKDAQDFSKFLKNTKYSGDGWEIINLVGANATERKIRDVVGSTLSRAESGDTIYIFFSGHGQSTQYIANDIYLVAYDSDPRLEFSGVEYDFFADKISNSKASNIIAFIDACRSGGVSSAKGRSMLPNQEFFSRIEVELNSGSNKVFFTAGSGLQLSWEDPTLKNGVFTHYLLKGLKDKEADLNQDSLIDLDEIEYYVRAKVIKHTESSKTMGYQRPRISTPTGEILNKIPLSAVD